MWLLRRRRPAPEGPNHVAIMNEAALLRLEMKRCSDPRRADEILVRMRELAVAIGALPAASTTKGDGDGPQSI